MGKFDEKNRFFYKRKWKEMSWEIIQFLWYWLHTASVGDGFPFSFHVMRKWKILPTTAGNSIGCFEIPFQLLFLEHFINFSGTYLRATYCWPYRMTSIHFKCWVTHLPITRPHYNWKWMFFFWILMSLFSQQ